MRNIEIRTPFPANFDIEIPFELPSSGRDVRYFPPIDAGKGRVYQTSWQFNRIGQVPWYGVFATEFTDQLSFASTMPDPDWVCISSAGTGYILNLSQPEDWKLVPVQPITGAVAVSEKLILLLSCFTRIVAYDQRGLKWITSPLCSDQLRLVGVNQSLITCTGWDAASNQESSFNIDLQTGRKL